MRSVRDGSKRIGESRPVTAVREWQTQAQSVSHSIAWSPSQCPAVANGTQNAMTAKASANAVTNIFTRPRMSNRRREVKAGAGRFCRSLGISESVLCDGLQR
jgi:hypothetical protein